MVVLQQGKAEQRSPAAVGSTAVLASTSQENQAGELQVMHSSLGLIPNRQQPAGTSGVTGSPTQLTPRHTRGSPGRVTSSSASGRTIHHHGQSPTKGEIPPLAVNPVQSPQLPSMNVSSPFKHLAALQQAQTVTPHAEQQDTSGPSLQVQVPAQQTVRRASGGLSPASASSTPRQFERTSPILSQFSALLPQKLSPKQQSPDRPPRKKIKLEEKAPPNEETANFRQLICDFRKKELASIKANYLEHLTELYFLQSGSNLMDYHSWKKKPPPGLVQVYKSGQLDSDDEDLGQEMKINDEVSGSRNLRLLS